MGKVYYIMAVFAAVFFTACQEDDFRGDTQGGIRITLAEEVGVDVTTRSTPEELTIPVEKDFTLKVVDQATNDTIYNGKYTSEIIPVSAGTYTIIAEYGEDVVLDADKPYYKGIAEDVQVSNSVIDASISCSVANALVSVILEDETTFKQLYPSAYFKVKIGNTEKNFSDYSQSAYFKAGSSLSLLTLYKNRTDGDHIDLLAKAKEVLKNDFPDPFKAKDHLKITLGLENTGSGVSIEVVKAEIDTITISETIPLEWLPKPKVEADGFTNNALTFVETETPPAKLNLDLASALQDIKFKFDFEDEQFSSLTKDKEYLLSTDKTTIEQALGITLPAIGATNASIDFSGLVAKLQSKVDGATTNKIMIVPQANNRWSSEKLDVDSVYKFTCNKPEFSIAVQEGNVWTKTFTIDEPTVTAGNAEVLKDKLVYQYKEKDADDNAWQTCSNGLEQAFLTVPDNKAYQVRAFYREGIVSDVVDVTLETPEQLPNSDMEEWQAPQLDSFVGIPNFWDKFYCYDFLPYKNGENDIWWSTNNKRSQDYTIARVKVTSSPCVSYSENVKNNGSRSTLIYTSGHGGEWASTSTELYSDGAFAGSLFIGKYNWNWDNSPQEEIISGHIFSSRPTSFKFWYKYIPKKSDAFKAYIELRNGDEVIASGTFIPETISSETDWIQGEITLDYGDSPKSATSIYVQFLSTTKTSFSEDDFDKNKSITFPVMGNWNAHIGSMLYIDDLSLIYEK